MSWPQGLDVLMFCKWFSTWIVSVCLKSELCGDPVTGFLCNRSNTRVRTEIVFKAKFLYVRNIILTSFLPVTTKALSTSNILLACLLVLDGKKSLRSNLRSNFIETSIYNTKKEKKKE